MFQELFFGAGAWLGLILYLSMTLAPAYKWRESGILFLPITIFLGITYLNESLEWHALIMFFTAVFIIYLLVKRSKD